MRFIAGCDGNVFMIRAIQIDLSNHSEQRCLRRLPQKVRIVSVLPSMTGMDSESSDLDSRDGFQSLISLFPSSQKSVRNPNLDAAKLCIKRREFVLKSWVKCEMISSQ